MANNRINLEFGTSYDGSGLDKLNGALKSHAGDVSRTIRSVSGLTDALGGLGGGFGKAGGVVSRFAGMFMAGGVFGVVTAAISAAAAAARKLSEAWKEANDTARQSLEDAEKMFAAHQRRLQSYEDKANERRRAAREKERAEREEEQRQRNREAENEVARARKRMNLERIAMQQANKEDELETRAQGGGAVQTAEAGVRAAQRNLDFMRKNAIWFDSTEIVKAENDLKNATKELEIARAEAADRQYQANRDAEELERKAAEAKEKRIEAERREQRIAEERIAGAARVVEIDRQIADAKKELAEREAAAARARGVSFNDWQRGEKRLEREARDKDRAQQGFVDRAKREQDAIASRIFKPDGTLRKSASDYDKRRYKDLQTFLVNQDPNNNPAIAAVKALEAKRQAQLDANARNLAAIKRTLEEKVGI